MKRVILAFFLGAISTVSQAVTVHLSSHNQTAGSGTISSLIFDGTHTEGQPASTAVWNWDGTTLSSTGLYSTVVSIGSRTTSATILNDQIVNLSISGGTASAASYACVEGTFMAVVGANGCGGYTLGVNTVDESTTVWSGTSVSQTIGGDDVLTGAARSISAYDFGFFSFTVVNAYSEEFGGNLDWATLVIGNGIALGSQGGEWMCFYKIYALSDGPDIPSCDEAIELASQAVPIPAAFWLFGSALGLLGWARRKTV